MALLIKCGVAGQQTSKLLGIGKTEEKVGKLKKKKNISINERNYLSIKFRNKKKIKHRGLQAGSFNYVNSSILCKTLREELC